MSAMRPPAPAAGPARFRRVRHLACRKVLAETVVLDLRQRLVFGLNDAAAQVLAALERPQTAAELAASGGNGAAEFLPTLASAGLVEPASESVDGGEASPIVRVRRDEAAGQASPEILWREQLAVVTQQFSPPMAIGNPQCLP